MSHQNEAAVPEPKTVCGFRVKVTQNILSSGTCRVKTKGFTSAFRADLVPVEGGQPVDVTLINVSDSTFWPVQLVANGGDYYSVTGLQPWLIHCGAGIGDKLQVERAGQRYSIQFIRGTTDGTKSAVTGGLGTNQQDPTRAGPHPDRFVNDCAAPRSVGAGTADAGGAAQEACGANAAGRRLDGRGWVRVDTLPAQHPGTAAPAQHRQSQQRSSQPGPGDRGPRPQHHQPCAPNSDAAVVQVKVEPGAEGARQQQGDRGAQGRGQAHGMEGERQQPREPQVQVQQRQPAAEDAKAAQLLAVKQEPQVRIGEGAISGWLRQMRRACW